MKREVIYRTDAMAAVGNLKGLLDTEKSKAMQAVLGVPAVQTCEDAVSRADVLETYADLYDVFEDSKAICKELHKVYDRINALPAVQPERLKGRWTDNNACPFCGFQPWYERDIHTLSYCPNCGADLRGEETDESD